MTEWTIVTVIIALVGLLATVGKPMMNLQKAITSLEVSINNFNRRLDVYESKTDEQEHRLENH